MKSTFNKTGNFTCVINYVTRLSMTSLFYSLFGTEMEVTLPKHNNDFDTESSWP